MSLTLSLAEGFELEGEFWLAAWAGSPVVGRLAFDPVEGGELDLTG